MYKLVKQDHRRLKRRSAALQEKILSMVNVESVDVSSKESAFLHKTLEDREEAFLKVADNHSAAALLWEQQKKPVRSGKGMR